MSLTIEISNGKQGVLRPVPVQDVPEADNSNSFAHKLDARAQLCAVYAGVLGVDLARIDVLEILQGLTKRGDVVGIDLVEVAPAYDPTESTQVLAAQLLLNFLGFIFHARASG